MNIYGYIYKIKNIKNNKIYFGQTIYNFKNRYHNNLSHYTHNLHLKNAINKDGIDNFEIDEKFDIAYSKDELDKLEDLYIKIYNTTNFNYGYNKRFGGSNGKLTEEAKYKLSIYPHVSGEKHHRYKKGYLVSGYKNPRAKMVICLNTMEIFDTADEASKKYIGDNRCGTQITACCSKKRKLKTSGILNGDKLIWMYYSDYKNSTECEIQEYIKEAKTNRQGENKVKKVICVTTNVIFNSITEASKYYNINRGAISQCCCGKSKYVRYKGNLIDKNKLYWSYYDD